MLCLIVALAAEVRPLLASYRLQGMSGHPYRICAGGQTHLIVSGVAKWPRPPLGPAPPTVNDDLLALQRRDEVLRYLQQLADMEFTLTR